MAGDPREPGPITMVVAANIREMRSRFRWSARELADRLPPELGLSRPTLANLDTGRRNSISVDELAALAEVFGFEYPWDLTQPLPPACTTCSDVPPPGFRCLVCGAGTPPVDAVLESPSVPSIKEPTDQ